MLIQLPCPVPAGACVGCCVEVLLISQQQHRLCTFAQQVRMLPALQQTIPFQKPKLTGDLGGHGVDLADLVTPVTAADGHAGHLGHDDGAADSGGHLLGALDTQTDVAVGVTDDNEGLRVIQGNAYVHVRMSDA